VGARRRVQTRDFGQADDLAGVTSSNVRAFPTPAGISPRRQWWLDADARWLQPHLLLHRVAEGSQLPQGVGDGFRVIQKHGSIKRR